MAVRTIDVAHATGLTYRQLDYLTHEGILGPAGRGSGNPKRWTLDQRARLAVTTAIVKAAGGGVDVPTVARHVAAGPDVPEATVGWVLMRPDGTVDYTPGPDHHEPGVVALYDLDSVR